MSSNVSPEEVEALLDERRSAAPSVSVRDFRLPRRLGKAQQIAIRAALTQRLLDVEQELRNWLRAEYPIELVNVGETTAVGLFEHLEDPIVVLSLQVAGVPGWVVWENDAALAASAVAMGGASGESQAEETPLSRSLTPLEAGVIGDILRAITHRVCDALELEVEVGSLSLDVRTFLAQLDPPGDGDPQRLSLHLSIDGPGGMSTIRYYLPGLLPERPTRETGKAKSLPGHLGEVPVEVSAQLGSLEVSLHDLMGVEIGDVIPLTLAIGEPLEITVEGEPAGRASWGSFRGRMAVRLESINTVRDCKQS